MAKTAKVNGVKVEDGETVTLVIRAKVKVHDVTKFDGTETVYVTFDSDPEGKSTEDSVYLETDFADKKRRTVFGGLNIVKDQG